MAITKDNRLCLWGSNFDGECGTGDISQSEMPSVLDFPHEITQISCGGFCSFALTKTGDLYGFGWNGFGNLGVGDNSVRKSPVLVSSDVQAIASGDFFSIALLKDGSLCSWGYNDKGQLGLGLGHDSETRPTLVPVSVSEKIIGVGCGGGFSYFVTELGDLYMWGGGAEGKLGSGSTENLFIPTFVRNFKARAPFFDMCEWESFRWLFLGKLDVGCIFSFLPKEVLFHFVQTLGQ
jgi:alpha-tubulin suppressor-like RCC1 family protein